MENENVTKQSSGLSSRSLICSTAVDQAIAIVLNAMAELEDESEQNERWYLPYLKLRNTFHHLCDVRFGLI